ncbi:unnamed protein product, partial [Heligmosomoides polygyrus]|uniref:ZM domain-containing protein n=1 Tax=Heligmosomoides polygyrus TaxID=6339 RepID=A0A183GF80_HELPZ
KSLENHICKSVSIRRSLCLFFPYFQCCENQVLTLQPPTCHPIEFPPIQAIYRHSSTTTAPVRSPVPLPSRYGVNAADEYHVYNKITTQDRTTTIHPNTKPKSPASDAVPVTPSFVYPTKKTEEESATYASSIGTTDEFGLEISNKVEGYRTETISSIYDLPAGLTLDPLPMPSPANVFYASNVKARSKREDAENITVEVEAKRMLVFSSDDSERIDTAALRRGGDSEKEPCGRVLIVQTVFLCVAAVLQV